MATSAVSLTPRDDDCPFAGLSTNEPRREPQSPLIDVSFHW
jgi:hypothetical protein